jgi:energy-coupling factor transport system ATP-binding protein
LDPDVYRLGFDRIESLVCVCLMIEIKQLTYYYPGQDRAALRDIDLKIPRGQFCGIVGANGAGKSTLCYALAGFVPHFFHGTVQGEVTLSGKDVATSNLGDLASEVGLVFQNPFNQISGARFTVREEIAFGLENLGLPRNAIAKRVDETIDLIGIGELAGRSSFALSGGQQQRVAIASILAMRPKLLILDEPTSQLDPQGAQDVFQILDKLTGHTGTTVILVEQKLEFLATFVDRVIVLSRGRTVLDGKPESILADKRIKKYGVGQTQYSLAAAAARKKNLVPKSRSLPVTLKQATGYFK